MELYVLDDLLRRIDVVDAFESLIWTERFSESGDFQLVIQSTSDVRALLTKNTKVVADDSYRVMTIESVEKKVDSEGRSILTVSGFSLEEGLKDRLAKQNFDNLELDPEWILTGTPRDIIKTIFNHICIAGGLDVRDIIPFMQEGDLLATPGSWWALPETLMWVDAIGTWADAYSSYDPENPDDPSLEITVTIKPGDLYSTIKNITDVYDLGFRIVRNGDLSELYFEVYNGNDRSSLQTYFDPVLFSADLDNLTDSTELTSISGSKNTAYVFSKAGTLVVYPDSAIATEGFERRILYVEVADTGEATGEDLDRLLRQRGLEELAKVKDVTAFDGEISKFGNYVYGVDYDLGDLVELRDSDGIVSKMRVTEQILVHDGEGERSYPTLVSEEVVDPGTWGGQPPYLEWVDAVGTWAEA